MSETEREYAANYRKPPLHTRFKKGQSGSPRGRPANNLAALLAAAMNETVTITEDGKHRQVTKREAVADREAPPQHVQAFVPGPRDGVVSTLDATAETPRTRGKRVSRNDDGRNI